MIRLIKARLSWDPDTSLISILHYEIYRCDAHVDDILSYAQAHALTMDFNGGKETEGCAQPYLPRREDADR
jgi:hypothetical protein